MHDDLIDAVNWAVKEGYADPKKVAIMGWSYGGYAALVGATFTPDTFACAVSVVGPSNLVTLLASVPPYWEPLKKMFALRVEDEGHGCARPENRMKFYAATEKFLATHLGGRMEGGK